MTTFPLPATFFRCPELSVDEREYMVNLAQKSLVELVRHSNLEGGPIRWSLDSDDAGLQLYTGSDPSAVGSEMTFLCSTTEIMASLDEVAALFRSDTTETFREYTRNFGKDLLDAQSLYTLARPTAENPRHFIGVKWMVLEVPNGLAKHRDMCYLECQDDFEMNGKRGWARSLNSIKLPCCPDLQNSLNLVRASIYRTGFVFLETNRPGYLKAMHAVQIDLKGNIPKFIVKMGAKRRARSIADIDQFLRERRLSGEVFLEKQQLIPRSMRSKCFLCSKKFGPFSKKKNCRKCGEVVCSSCSKYWDINVNGLGRSMIRVCSACSVGTFHKGLPRLQSAFTDNASEQDSTDYNEEGKRVLSRHSHHTPRMARGLQRPPQDVNVSLSSKQAPFSRREPEAEPPVIAANRHMLPAARSIKTDLATEPSSAPQPSRASRYTVESSQSNNEYVGRHEEWQASDHGSNDGGARYGYDSRPIAEARYAPVPEGRERGDNDRYEERSQESREVDPRFAEQPPQSHELRVQGHEPRYLDARFQETRNFDPRYNDYDPRYPPNHHHDPRFPEARYPEPRYQEPRYYGQQPARYYDDDRYYDRDPRYMDPRYLDPRYNDRRYVHPRHDDRDARGPPRLLEHPDMAPPSSDGPTQETVDLRAPPTSGRHMSATSDDEAQYRPYAPLNAQNLAAFTANGATDPSRRHDDRFTDARRPIIQEEELRMNTQRRDDYNRRWYDDELVGRYEDRPDARYQEQSRYVEPSRYMDPRDQVRFRDQPRYPDEPRYLDEPRYPDEPRYDDQPHQPRYNSTQPRYNSTQPRYPEEPLYSNDPRRLADREPKAAPTSELSMLAQQMASLGVQMDPAAMTPAQLKALYNQLQKLNLDDPKP
ncbi:hypothetical protein SDRG_14702 [Saprolegnia diclina VS20]|uniref:FYVE-type domain-containing protein n=1 Tax=Saprolegnia diclina (strain VS20) TaxID=1156394 RepID=T0Q2A6_SAPDV|nr:hypothetical protein SDRG_14702 [Saprolegnia diclina VS20]EQC27500.1 hypothetical protein SDRG_14702 [Saprolegnia diclina VS20]|eukprot:XP_008619074.1 hypothetical protein SDRG_14702 [Saprolegnia diclina VS20]